VNGLRGARVVVVDDEPEEALPILKALSKIGVSAVYFDGGKKELPRRADRLTGVRLAILDMDIVGGGTDDKSKASALVKYLTGILSPGNGPYAVLAWTKHAELIEHFEKYLFEQSEHPNPIFVAKLEKAECKKGKRFDLSLVAQKLKTSLQAASPLLFLQGWEGQAFEAATRVTNELSSITGADSATLSVWREQWKSEVVRLMHTLAQAQAGQHLDQDSCFRHLYDSLNPLHADALERGTMALSLQLRAHADEIVNATPECGPDRKARLNALLHLSFENLGSLATGNIYVLSHKNAHSRFPGIGELLKDFVGPPNDDAAAKRLKEMAQVVTAIAIEISAVCDYAQGNVRVPRFLSGLFIPVEYCKKLKARTGFLWRFGPLFLDHSPVSSGRYELCFSARHLVTLEDTPAQKLKVFARLRPQALTDLQAMFAQHASRPGIMRV